MAVRTLTLGFSALSTRSFVCPADGLLLGGISSAVSWVVSTDPSATYASKQTSLGNNTIEDVLLAANNTNFSPNNANVKIPVQVGKTYFVAASAAGSVNLYFEDLAEK